MQCPVCHMPQPGPHKMDCRPSERVAARVFGPPQKRPVADAAPSGWYPALRGAAPTGVAREQVTTEAAYRSVEECGEIIKVLADALEEHGRQVACPRCGGVGSRTCHVCDHGEKPTHHPQVVAALRLAGRLPKESP